ncbi:hypothetical protein K492DRAFT_234763 [Lichtheimia hyalospora FSU 10163]|nr:hypothetical protein K492DRAFT_234763 [Lichtheimia hyalospora FSU 10163]
MTAPARRSVRTQPPRKSTSRSTTVSQPLPSLQHDTHSTAEDEDDEEELDQEESSDGGSVTRCLCGEQHNVGLMVQCDRCEVWQHCDCVGLTESDMPDLYYCDHCQPDNHVLYKSHGRYKRAYDPNGNYNNNKKEDHSYPSNGDDVDHRPVKRKKRQDTRRPRKRPSSRSQKNHAASVSDKHEDTTEDEPPEDEGSTSPTTSTTPSIPATVATHATAQSTNTMTTTTITTSNHSTMTTISSPSSPRTPAPPSNHTNHSTPTKKTSNGRSRNGPSPQQQEKRMKKGSPRLSTPDDMPSLHQPYWDQDGLPVRESSPPARIKYPNPKMSITEMNKRAKQILDYVSKLQIDMATKRRERSNSTSSASSSLSSASTLPLAEDDHQKCVSPTTPIPALEQALPPESTLEMMDRITHDLVMFQRKFGSTLKR